MRAMATKASTTEPTPPAEPEPRPEPKPAEPNEPEHNEAAAAEMKRRNTEHKVRA